LTEVDSADFTDPVEPQAVEKEIQVSVVSALSADTILSVRVPRKTTVEELCTRAQNAVPDRRLDKLMCKDRLLRPSETFDSVDFADLVELQAVFAPCRFKASLYASKYETRFSGHCSITVAPGSGTEFDELCTSRGLNSCAVSSNVALLNLTICSQALQKDPEVEERVRALFCGGGEPADVLLAEKSDSSMDYCSRSYDSHSTCLILVADHLLTISSSSSYCVG
jgi:hypothetical protein